MATGVALAEATGDGLGLWITLAKALPGSDRFKANNTKNNRKIGFRMEVWVESRYIIAQSAESHTRFQENCR